MMEYFGMYFKQFPNMCQHQDESVTAKNSLFIFTKCRQAEASSCWKCAFILRICRFNTCHTFQTNKSLHPAFRQTILERNAFLNKKMKINISLLRLLCKIIASCAVRASARIFCSFISSSISCEEYFFCNFILH